MPFVSYFCCSGGILLSTVLVIHIDPPPSIHVSCRRQWCSYISTSGALALRIDGVETVGVHIGDLWKNLETLSGRWEKQQQRSFNSESPWKKVEEEKKKKKNLINQYRSHQSQSETRGWRSHLLSPLGRGHCKGLSKYQRVFEKNIASHNWFHLMFMKHTCTKWLLIADRVN